MKIPKIEMLLLLDNAIIAGLLFYIFNPRLLGAAICFLLVLVLGILLYHSIRRILKRH